MEQYVGTVVVDGVEDAGVSVDAGVGMSWSRAPSSPGLVFVFGVSPAPACCTSCRTMASTRPIRSPTSRLRDVVDVLCSGNSWLTHFKQRLAHPVHTTSVGEA